MVPVHRFLLAVLAVLGSSAPARASSRDVPPVPEQPTETSIDVVYPPAFPDGPAPVTVFLHGMCDTPENECGYFARTVTRRGWLVCPRAPDACGNGGSRWGRGDNAARLEAVIQGLRVRYPDRVAISGRTIIGFSQGAFVAGEILQRSPRSFDYALLIAGKVPLQSTRVTRGGVLRLLLSAGDRDRSSSFMQSATRSLVRGGVDARFSSLGNVGHSFATDMDTWLEGALAWLWSERHTV